MRRFPDAHAELTVQLLRTIRTELGEDALDRLIGAREEETRTSYHAEMADTTDLQDKVARLAAIRTREGYMAEWSEDGDGYLLVENHCPICAAATLCQGFCRAELSVFQEVLGNRGASHAGRTHSCRGEPLCLSRDPQIWLGCLTTTR